VTGQSFAIFGGGKGANQTIACARSWDRTAILGAVGNDDFGRQRLASLKSEGVDVESVALVDDVASGVALILIEEGGENRIAYVPGATGNVSATQAKAAINRLDPGVVLSTLELPHEALSTLIRGAKEIGATVIVNATPEPSQGKDVAALADILIVNESEAAELLDVNVGDGHWEEFATRLLELGHQAVVITLGSQGAIFKHANSTIAIPAPQVNVVDTTGAGDAFCGAFAAFVAQGAKWESAAEIGVAAGALAVTKRGAQPSMPDRAEILKLVRKK
jgi:ribokinase